MGQLMPLLRDNLTDQRTDAVDMGKFHEVMVVFMIGATDTTVDCNVKESPLSGGAYTLLSGKSALPLGGSDDNKIIVINVKSEELSPGMQFIKGEIDVGDGTTGANTAVLVLGMRPRFAPASEDDLAAVTQILT